MKPLIRRRHFIVTLALLCVLSTHFTLAQNRPATTDSTVAVRGAVIPTGFQNGKYSAMIQIAVAGSPSADATWELATSFVSRGKAAREFPGRVIAAEPNMHVALETQLEFEPGDISLNLEAREASFGLSATGRALTHWPDPDSERGTVSPVAMLQPAQGTFARGRNVRSQGALVVGADDAVQSQLPTAVISVVCRGPGVRDTVHIERMLEGTASVEFETIELQPGQEQCAQVRDIIPAEALGAGIFRYVVQLSTDTGELAAGGREFFAEGN